MKRFATFFDELGDALRNTSKREFLAFLFACVVLGLVAALTADILNSEKAARWILNLSVFGVLGAFFAWRVARWRRG